MTRIRPRFMDTPYFVDEPGNWHVTKDAPKEIKKEFDAYMREINYTSLPGTIHNNRISYP